MPHTKVRENRPDPDAVNKYHSPYPRRLYIKFGFDWQSGFEEDLLSIVNDDDDDGRQMDAGP